MSVIAAPDLVKRLPDAAVDLAIAAAATIALVLFHAVGGFPTLADSGADNDSVMRLVQVRDLLAGQSWFDTRQYRMGLDDGFLMHWSRLVDLPIAALIVILGETATLVLWPSLLFCAALLLILRSARRLAGQGAVLPATVVGGLALYHVNVFPPGALDHHNVQLVLALATMHLLPRAGEDRWSAAAAGACAALMLAIGMEAAPLVAVACATPAVLYLADGWKRRRMARDFGLGFAGTAVLAFVATRAPDYWTAAQCDAYSLPQAALALLGGGGLAAIAAVPALGDRIRPRAGALAALALAAGCVAVAAFPECLADPYAGLDPRLKAYWLSAVREAQPVWSVLRTDPAMFAGFYLTPAIALAFCGWKLARREAGVALAIVAGFVVAAFAVSLWQVRGAMFSVPLAAVPLAMMIAGAREAAHTQASPKAQLAMAAAWICSFSVVWQSAASLWPAGAATSSATAAERCYAHADYQRLAGYRPTTVLAISNLGASILRETHHRVLAGPYHRNIAGNLAALDMLMGTPDAARLLADQHGVDLVSVCPGNPETAALAGWAPDGLLARLLGGRAPLWLEPVGDSRDEPVVIYRVLR